MVNLSAFRLNRVFRKEVGVPPQRTRLKHGFTPATYQKNVFCE